MLDKLSDDELKRLGYAVEDGRLDDALADELLKDPEKARDWLAAHDQDYDPY